MVMLLAIALPAAGFDRRSEVPETVQQGSLVVGHTQPRNTVELAGHQVRIGKDGAFVFGVGRDEAGPLRLVIDWFDGAHERVNVAVTPRDWPIERITGVTPATTSGGDLETAEHTDAPDKRLQAQGKQVAAEPDIKPEADDAGKIIPRAAPARTSLPCGGSISGSMSGWLASSISLAKNDQT